jgi:hypothetical protein
LKVWRIAWLQSNLTKHLKMNFFQRFTFLFSAPAFDTEDLEGMRVQTDHHGDRAHGLPSGEGASLGGRGNCRANRRRDYPAPRHYYETIFKPAIEKTGLHAVRADAEIFATGKIIDQVWRGINAAKVLVAELTTRNANVFYELGLAHALNKPVVLVSSNESDVPFDLQHIRVIYYDVI